MKFGAWRAWRKVLVTSSTLLLLSGCPLTDQQITSITQSVISTGLNTIVSNLLQSAFTTGGA